MRTNILSKYTTSFTTIIVTIVAMVVVAFQSAAQTPSSSTLTAPYNPVMAPPSMAAAADSIMLPFASGNAVPQTYEQLLANEIGSDLDTPSNVRTIVD